MCIVLISTAHPSYSLILINNRDEYLSRPTALAAFWDPPNSHVVGGRDLLRAAQGTWLGVTLDGRIAVLTNYREENAEAAIGATSRGAMVNAFLTPPATARLDVLSFLKTLVSGDGVRGVGGFSLVCGQIGEGKLAVVSNRTSEKEGIKWIGEEETVGLSNAAFRDRSWPKVVDGERLLGELVEGAVTDKVGKKELIERLMQLLERNTLPPRQEGQDWEAHVKELRKSIFIPVVGDVEEKPRRGGIANARIEKVESVGRGMGGAYGTQKHTVVLADHEGNITFVERTLFGHDVDEVMDIDKGTRTFEFKMQKQAV